jgi:thiol-disulfide isomerase/thioredoxin
MINRLIIFFLLALAITGCKKNSIQISGKFENPVKGEYLYLSELKAKELNTELVTVDSLKIGEDGVFSFQREETLPTFYLLKTNNNNFFMALIEPGEKLKIEAMHDSLNNPSSVSGSKGTKKMVEYDKALNNTISKLMSLNEIYNQNAGSPELPKVIKTLDSMAQQYLNGINTYTKKYIDENINSLISLVALYKQVAPRLYVLDPVKDLNYFMKVDSSLFRQYPESTPVKALHEQVQQLVSQAGTTALLKVGNEAPEISLPDANSKIVTLSSTRGNIVLLDFWASWCSPCRKENPNLVKAFNLYSRKGFTIFQVSLDKTKEDWLTGIKDDKLSAWIHVSDLKYWNSVVVPLYKIESIPYNLLLDKEGKIIAANLRGESLQEKLAELYK